jgi:hypothetical protein
MNFQELTKREKVLAIFFIAITVIYAVARGVTEYLLDPDRLLPLIILSLGGVLFFYLMQRLSMRRKALITNKSNSSLQKIYSIFYFLLVCAIIIGGYIELYDKISKLKTESPFFIPTRETIVNNYNNKIADFNEVIKLMEKSNSNQIIINMQNQDVYKKYYPKIVQKLNSLEITFAAKYPNQISLSIFKSKKKSITFLSTSKLINDIQEKGCEKIKTNFYLCTFDNP